MIANLPDASWFKSSRSGAGPSCVEVAFSDGRVGVRDSKNPGPMFVFGVASWRIFRQAVR